MSRLTIPLSNTDRPIKRHLAHIGILLALFLSSWLLTRAYIALDTTSWLSPETATYRIHIPMYANSIEQLTENIGSEPLIAGSPWTLDQLPLWCNRACSLYLNDESELFALTIDRPLTEMERAQVTATGLYLTEINEKTLISQINDEPIISNKTIWPSFRLLLPWNDAVFTNLNTSQRAAISISDRGVVIRAVFDIFEPHQSIFTQDTNVLAQISFPLEETPYPILGQAVDETTTSLLKLLRGLTISLTVAEHNGNLTYSIQLPIVLNQQEAAALSRELIKTSSLSTLEWTLNDGTTLDEIRFDNDSITVKTRSDGNNYYMEVFKDTITVLRLTQTDDSLLISNVEISLSSDTNTNSSCLRSTRSFIRPKDLLGFFGLPETFSAQRTYSFFTSFEEIAFSSRKTMLCWE